MRDVVFRICSAGGLLLAMPWALSYKAAPVRCASPGGQCLAHGVTSSLIPILLRMGGGLLLGAIRGTILCLAVPGLTPSSFPS